MCESKDVDSEDQSAVEFEQKFIAASSTSSIVIYEMNLKIVMEVEARLFNRTIPRSSRHNLLLFGGC